MSARAWIVVICATCWAVHGRSTEGEAGTLGWREEFALLLGPRRLDGRLYVHGTAKSEQDWHLFGVLQGAHLIPRPWQKSQAFAILRLFFGAGSALLMPVR
jgi:hypothetical protein